MFNFKNIASGSTGNCYLVSTLSGSFLLDAGVKKLDKIIENVNLNDLDFAFISHNHKDHSMQKEKLATRGVCVVDGNLIQDFTKIGSKGLKSGLFSLWCFPLEHGNEKSSAIIIKDTLDNELILYATDFNNWTYDLSQFKFTRVIVECNYIEGLVVNATNKIRSMDNIDRHLGLNGTKRFINQLNISNLKEIILCHQSQNFGDSVMMGTSIFNEFDIPVKVCRQYGGVDYYG